MAILRRALPVATAAIGCGGLLLAVASGAPPTAVRAALLIQPALLLLLTLVHVVGGAPTRPVLLIGILGSALPLLALTLGLRCSAAQAHTEVRYLGQHPPPTSLANDMDFGPMTDRYPMPLWFKAGVIVLSASSLVPFAAAVSVCGRHGRRDAISTAVAVLGLFVNPVTVLLAAAVGQAGCWS